MTEPVESRPALLPIVEAVYVTSILSEVMSVIDALDSVLHLPPKLETNDLVIESQFLLPVGRHGGSDSMTHKVTLVSKRDEVGVD